MQAAISQAPKTKTEPSNATSAGRTRGAGAASSKASTLRAVQPISAMMSIDCFLMTSIGAAAANCSDKPRDEP